MWKSVFVGRMPPPLFKRSAPFVVGPIGSCEWIGLREQQLVEEQNVRGGAALLVVEVDTVGCGNAHALVSYMRGPVGEVTTCCEFLGESHGEGTPLYAQEMAVVDALDLVKQFLEVSRTREDGAGSEGVSRQRAVVSAGDGVTCARIHDWLARRGCRLQSAAAPRLAVLCSSLASTLGCPLTENRELTCSRPITPTWGQQLLRERSFALSFSWAQFCGGIGLAEWEGPRSRMTRQRGISGFGSRWMRLRR